MLLYTLRSLIPYRAEIDKALEELGKVSDTDAVYKHAGSMTCQIYQICIN